MVKNHTFEAGESVLYNKKPWMVVGHVDNLIIITRNGRRATVSADKLWRI